VGFNTGSDGNNGKLDNHVLEGMGFVAEMSDFTPDSLKIVDTLSLPVLLFGMT
jgi:hypothetical protein